MTEGETAALHAVVRGRVQAVGFRQFVFREARTLRLTGWVRNGDDGRSVEVVAEGPRAALESLLALIREGPRLARVEAVDAVWSEAAGRFDRFEIRF